MKIRSGQREKEGCGNSQYEEKTRSKQSCKKKTPGHTLTLSSLRCGSVQARPSVFFLTGFSGFFLHIQHYASF
jgi:hypothetical protein